MCNFVHKAFSVENQGSGGSFWNDYLIKDILMSHLNSCQIWNMTSEN